MYSQLKTLLIQQNQLSSFKRCITTSCNLFGKRNFRKFRMVNLRGPPEYLKKIRGTNAWDNQGMREPIVRVEETVGTIDSKTRTYRKKETFVPEMIPELIVPDLNDFKLKPYVSYRTADVIQPEFTAKDLFDAIYSTKIVDDFKNNKLDEDGNPLEPSEEEKLTAKEAKIRAKSVGSDIFE